MKLCLLAAGFAKRMYPLTRDRAKPLLDVGGQPMLSRLLAQARATGAMDEVATVLASRFEDEFRAWNDQLAEPVTLLPNGAQEDSQARGAVADLALLLKECFPQGSEDGYLVLAGDNLLRFDLAEPLAAYRERPSAPLLLVRGVPEPIPPGKYSEVVVDPETQAISSFREKPQDPESPWSAIGVYFMPPDLPELLDHYLAADGEADAPGHFFVWLSKVRRCQAWQVPDGGWFDVGSLSGLETARAMAEEERA